MTLNINKEVLLEEVFNSKKLQYLEKLILNQMK
jgi:hypothetical protein